MAAAFGYASPILVRSALTGGRRDPATVGWLFAASTAGGAAACLAANVWIVPALGTSGALLAFALLLAAAAPLAGRRIEVPWTLGLVVVLLAAVLPFDAARSVGARLGLRAGDDALFSEESRYGRVVVDRAPDAAERERPDLRRLVIDGFVHGYVDPSDPAWLGYGYEGIYAAVTERVTLAGGTPPRALFLGGGGYVFPRWLARQRPGAEIDVVEIDPVVTRAAREALGLPDPAPFRIHHEDARTYVEALSPNLRVFDLVYADAFDDLSVPWHLTTTEFLDALARRTAPGGVLLLNLVDVGAGGRFLGAIVATLRQTHGYVVVLGPKEHRPAQETFVVVASDRPLDLRELARPAGTSKEGSAPIRSWTPEETQRLVVETGGRVLRDDHAPVESLLAPVVRRRIRR
jgi:hypothetical protein